jgi:hypothetical protein
MDMQSIYFTDLPRRQQAKSNTKSINTYSIRRDISEDTRLLVPSPTNPAAKAENKKNKNHNPDSNPTSHLAQS